MKRIYWEIHGLVKVKNLLNGNLYTKENYEGRLCEIDGNVREPHTGIFRIKNPDKKGFVGYFTGDEIQLIDNTPKEDNDGN